MGFPSESTGKEFACNAGDLGLIPKSRRYQGEGNGNPLQYFYVENPWTEELSRLQSMELQRFGHNCVTNFHFHFFV